MATTVVHCRRSHYDVYIGRPSIFGNPFVIGKDGSRQEVILKYKEWVKTQPLVLKEIKTLKDKILGCYCKPFSCHGDILAKLADETYDIL